MAPHIPQKKWSTPHRTRVQTRGVVAKSGILKSPGGHTIRPKRLFREDDIPPTTGYRLASSTDPRTLKNSEQRLETRGRKKKLSERDIRAVEIILWQGGYDGRVLSWQHLVIEAGLEVCGETLRVAMRSKDYRRCKVYRR